MSSMDIDMQSLSINIAGTKVDLEKMWAELRKRGWFLPPDNRRPKDGEPSWCGFFRRERDENITDPELVFLMFSSTICRRVKIGTRTVEEDIYETKCGPEETPSALAAMPDPAPLLDSILPPGVGVHIEGGFQDSQGREVDLVQEPTAYEPTLLNQLPPLNEIVSIGLPTSTTPAKSTDFDDDIPF